MYKIRKIEFINHPIVKNLKLDFCDESGKAVDTVFFAGENGTGKSTILNSIYEIASRKVRSDICFEMETPTGVTKFAVTMTDGYPWISDSNGFRTIISNPGFYEKYQFNGIFSDVDINFHAGNIQSVTSMNLDCDFDSRKSSNNLPQEINQLLIDIQALDANAVLQATNDNPDVLAKDLPVERRMPRFTDAFSRMFDDLAFSRIDNVEGHKEILFKKYGLEIPINQLSSGEKQVVYRGCFLLKDANALNGAFVFIDEPEISLHPTWQQKIMDYYKEIFTNAEGTQTSQIFAVTHSPFVVHNDNRRNDKVIVLTRDENGDIAVKDKPEYFKCNSVEAVEDAFSIHAFGADQSTVYVEGQTDEKYFTKALKVYEIEAPFRFKWVGYIDDKGQEANTGDKSVDKAFQFLIAQDLPIINICLKDCDTNREIIRKGNVVSKSIPKYENAKGMQKGIENALVLDAIDVKPFYCTKTKCGDYGEDNITTITEFKKMEFCDYICSLESETLKAVFSNLKEVIDSLISIFD